MQPSRAIVIVGYGKMARSIAKGLSGKFPLQISGRNLEKIHSFIKENSLNATPLFPLSRESISAKHLILCIKPQALGDFHASLNAKNLTQGINITAPAAVYSIMAGVSISSLRALFSKQESAHDKNQAENPRIKESNKALHSIHECADERGFLAQNKQQESNGATQESTQIIKNLAQDLTHKSQITQESATPPIIRAMPNIAATAQSSCTALCGDESARDFAQAIFSALGSSVWLSSEDKLDSATALCGSGPAYLALVAESLIDSGVREGLTRDEAEGLTRGLFGGFSALLCAHNPTHIKEETTSPAGTTAEGLAVLEKHGLRGIFIEAVHRAKARAVELSKLWN